MDPSPEEKSLNNIGFTEDANAEETDPSGGGVAVEEAEHTEETGTEEHAEEIREEDGTEAEVSEEEAEPGSEVDGAAAEEETPQGYDLMLPNKQLKDYPDELYQLAAKKFGVDPSQIEHQGIKSLLKGKIDSDIEIRNLHDRLDTGADDDTIVDGEEEETAAAAPAEEAVTPEKQIELTYSFLRGGLDGHTPVITKTGAKMYSEASLAAYTELSDALESGDPKKIEAAQIRYTESQAAFATVMFANVLPALLPHMIQNLPPQLWDGIVGGKLEERDQIKETHKSARDLLMKDPRYADLQGMVTSGQIYAFAKENPEILNKTFVDANGKKITDPVKLAMAQYRYVVHQIRGQNYRPATELVKKGMEAGKRQADTIAQRKANGRFTTGRTRGGFGQSADRYDPKTWAERMKRSAEAANPLGAFLENAKP
jgi:hypothetical protein